MNKFRNCICFAHPPICWQCHTLGGNNGANALGAGPAEWCCQSPSPLSSPSSWSKKRGAGLHLDCASSILDCHHHLLLLLFCEFELPECCHFRLPPSHTATPGMILIFCLLGWDKRCSPKWHKITRLAVILMTWCQHNNYFQVRSMGWLAEWQTQVGKSPGLPLYPDSSSFLMRNSSNF